MQSQSATFKTLIGIGIGVFFCCLPAGNAGAQTCVQPPSGLVSWWPGDGAANDIQDGNNGSLQNGATFGAGTVGQAFVFDGTNDFVDAGNASNLHVSSGDFTVDAWVLFHSLTRPPGVGSAPQGDMSIVDKMNPSGVNVDGWRLIKQDNNRFWMCLGGSSGNGCGGGGTTVQSTTAVTTNAWYHVAAVKAGNTMSIYVNGAHQASTTLGTFKDTHAASLILGNNTLEGGFLNGRLDEVGIYNRALATSEIQAIFSAGAAGKCKAPDADAGADQAVDEGTIVTLDGSQSSGLNPSYLWEQIAGPTVSLTGDTTTNPTFGAPMLSGGVSGNQTLTFKITVTASSGLADSDTVDVTVKNVNHAPVADAGPDQFVDEGSSVALSATNSYDSDGDAIACQWVQTCGSAVTLSGDATCQPSFTASLVPGGLSGSETLCFDVSVSDTALSATDAVLVTVEQVNHAPAANAGPDQTKFEGSLVTLDGTASRDPDTDPVTCSWSQVSGLPITLSSSASCTPSFTAPAVGPGGDTLVLRLSVSDSQLQSAPDDVTISVQNLNDPPNCSLAQASPTSLWPPNHKLISVAITGITDPNNNQVTISITGVTQDEPVNGLGDGDTSPDALLQGSTVLVRAERSGSGNGRVYSVQFTADDGQGGVCSGATTVGVPKSMKPGTPIIDDGQLYNSTQP